MGERMSRFAVGLVGALATATWLAGCPAPPPGLEIVPVPASAYLPWDGGHLEAGAGDAAREAAVPVVVCVATPDEAPPEAEAADDYEECAAVYQGHGFDPEATEHHRGHGEAVCCYHRGHTHRSNKRVIRLAPMD